MLIKTYGKCNIFTGTEVQAKTEICINKAVTLFNNGVSLW